MKTLEHQLADYGAYVDRVSGPTSLEDITLLRTVATAPGFRRRSPAWAFAVAAAIVAVLIGALQYITRLSGEDTAGNGDRVPINSDIGDLIWTEVVGSIGTLPAGGIEIDPNGSGFVSYADGLSWHSQDGVEWMRVATAPIPEGYDEFWVQGDWAVAELGDAITLFELIDASWVPIEFPTPPLGTDDLVWWVGPGELIRSGETSLVLAHVSGQIPWDSIYGAWTYDCGLPEPCTSGPFAIQADRESTLLSVRSPEDESEIARLEIDVFPDALLLRDVANGAVVYSVAAESEEEARSMATRLLWGDPPGRADGVWTRSEPGQPFVFSPLAVPDGPYDIYPTSDGFVIYRLTTNKSAPGGDHVGVWTSPDGHTWESHGTPGFATADATGYEVQPLGDGFVATAADERSIVRHISEDGVDWEPWSVEFPVAGWFSETAHGIVATTWSTDPTAPAFWISRDGDHWVELPAPQPLFVFPNEWAGSAEAGAVGDILYYSVADEGGTRRLWIGRFAG